MGLPWGWPPEEDCWVASEDIPACLPLPGLPMPRPSPFVVGLGSPSHVLATHPNLGPGVLEVQIFQSYARASRSEPASRDPRPFTRLLKLEEVLRKQDRDLTELKAGPRQTSASDSSV